MAARPANRRPVRLIDSQEFATLLRSALISCRPRLLGQHFRTERMVTGPNSGLRFVLSKENSVEPACCARSSFRPAENSGHNSAR